MRKILLLVVALFAAIATKAEVVAFTADDAAATSSGFTKDGVAVAFATDTYSFNADVREFDGESFTGFISGANNPKVNGSNFSTSSTAAPTTGSVIKITPSKDGELTLYVVVNNNKATFVAEDATAISFTVAGAVMNPGDKFSAKYNGSIVVPVKAGKTYSFFCNGSKMGFYGFNFEATTLNSLVEKAKKNNETEIDLEGKSWDLEGTAELPLEMTIKNGTIVADSTGNLSAQSKLVLDNVKIDATAAPEDGVRTIAPIQLSANPIASLYNQTEAVYYTEEEAAAYNEEHAAEIEAHELDPVTTETIKTASAPKYANSTWKGYEAQEVTIEKSEIKTAAPLIRTAKNWSLRELNIDSCIVEVTYKSGKAVIDFEENGAGVIQDINIKKSTLFADDEATDMRFLRYAAQNDPWRVWGYEGSDKNATKNTWAMESNTLVNLCGNKEFANNIKNTAATELTWTKNVFANCWRLQKVGSNCKRNFTAADNAICGGKNTVDGTDASKWATEDKDMGVYANAEEQNFTPTAMSFTDLKQYGDPRWITVPIDFEVNTLNDLIKVAVMKQVSEIDLQGKSWNLEGTAELPLEMTIKNGEIVADSTGNLSAQSKFILENVKIDATATTEAGSRTIAPIQLSANPAASLYNQTEAVYYTEEEAAAYNEEHAAEIEAHELDPVTTETIKTASAPKYANSTWKGYEAQEVTIKDSEVKTAAPLIHTAKNWSLRKFNVDNSIVEVKYKSGKAVIDFEENGAGVIQDINIKNSTLYADSANTDMRFIRYASQNDPWRVWGYEGSDKNATKNTWTMESNTLVNLCGNKEFANNIKNANTTELTWTKNVFANCWRLQKVGGNCKRNFTAADNAICGGTNTVDGTDASKWATEDKELGVFSNAEGFNFFPYGYSYAYMHLYGDPRWIVENQSLDVAKKLLELKIEEANTLLGELEATDVKDVLQDATDDAQGVYDNAETTEEGFGKATQDLDDAIKRAQIDDYTIICEFDKLSYPEGSLANDTPIYGGNFFYFVGNNIASILSGRGFYTGDHSTSFSRYAYFVAPGNGTLKVKATPSEDNCDRFVAIADAPKTPAADASDVYAHAMMPTKGEIVDLAYDVQEGETYYILLYGNGTITSLRYKGEVNASGIKSVNGNASSAKNGKFIEGNQLIIMKEGKKYNAAGQMMK